MGLLEAINHAEIKLGDFPHCARTGDSTGEIAKAIAKEVWKAAGLQNKPLMQLKFFANLRRARCTPFYNINGIHCKLEPDTTSSTDEEEAEIFMLGGYGMRSVRERTFKHFKNSGQGRSTVEQACCSPKVI